MTWRWRICFSWLCASPAFAASVAGAVHLANSTNPALRGRQDHSGIVVWLEPTSERLPPLSAAGPATARMVQKDKRFIPHVLAVPVGATVEFPNYDPIFHNAFSNFNGQIFDVGLYPPGTSRVVTFRRAGIVRVFCNIHPTMSAVIAVLDTPWYSVSLVSGAFLIRDVPPGDYRLRLFHERATPDTLKSLEHEVTVTAQGLVLPPIQISETGYVAAPHKNKYGNDYPPVADGPVAYPGGRR